MKRLLLPAVLAAGVLAASSGDALAHGAGFGLGLGIDINVNMSWWMNRGGANGCDGGMQGPGYGGCCGGPCVIPGWSPYYNKPTMFSGMKAAGYTYNPAPIYYGPFPYHGGYDAVGFVPARPPAPPYPPAKLIEKKPLPGGKIIEKNPPPGVMEKVPPSMVIEGGAPGKN
jgi:hypothetical protein